VPRSSFVLAAVLADAAGILFGSVVFTLLFLAPTFAPVELMGASRLRLASEANPLTYAIETMRRLVSGTGNVDSVIVAFVITSAAGVGGAVLAARSVRNVLN